MSAADLSDDERAALADALRAEHAAVWGYGVVAAFAAPQRRGEVGAAERVHRQRRDDTTELLTAQGADAPVAEPAYAVPVAVSDGVGAATLAALLEDGAASAWRAVIARAEPGVLRGTALDALVDAATRSATWRGALEQDPVTAFPGRP